MLLLHTNTQGQVTRLPNDFQFPNGNAYDCWGMQWNIGNAGCSTDPATAIGAGARVPSRVRQEEAQDGYRKTGAARFAH
jgi:hypothetical protein